MNIRHIILWAACIVLTLQPSSTKAQHSFIHTNEFVLSKSNTLDEAIWVLANQEISIEGTAADEFLFAVTPHAPNTNGLGTAHLVGTFSDSVWGLAGSIALGGNFEKHVRVLGFRSIGVQGHINGNLIAVIPLPNDQGSTVAMSTGSVVNGDAYLRGLNITMNGNIDGDAEMYGSSIVIGGIIEGDVFVNGDDVEIHSKAQIHGNLSHSPGTRLLVSNPQSIQGDIKEVSTDPATGAPFFNAFMARMMTCLSIMVIGILFVGFAPDLATQTVYRARHSFVRSAITGILMLVFLILSLLIFGSAGTTGWISPLTIFLLASTGMSVCLAHAVALLLFGTLIARRRASTRNNSAMPPMISGMIIYLALLHLPADILTPCIMVITFVGIGALMLALMDKRNQHIRQLQQVMQDRTEPQ